MSIAVVIPVRNRPDVLTRAVRSVQAQTFAVDEIIIVDDGSTDRTGEVIRELAAKDGRVRFVRQLQRKGASAARNLGVRRAHAEWIAFLDSDDEWMPRKIERQIAHIAMQPDCVASFTGYQTVSDGPLWESMPPESVSLFDLQKINVLGTTSTAMVRRSILIKAGGFDERLPSCQDWDLWIKLRTFGPFCTVSDILVSFHQGGTDRISKNMDSVLNGHRIIFQRIMSNVKRSCRRRVSASHNLRMTQIFLWDIDKPGRAMTHALRSFIAVPSREAGAAGHQGFKRLTGKVRRALCLPSRKEVASWWSEPGRKV